MPAHIPPGREHLWQRQAESDAEVERLDTAVQAAWRRRNDLAQALDWDDSIVEDADHELDQLLTQYNQAVARNDRIYQERLAGLTSHLDHDPTAPACPDCQGTGGPPGSDAHSACPTCRGWGREHREPIPVWHDESQEWINPATGHPVDLLAEPDPPLDRYEQLQTARDMVRDGSGGHLDMPPAAQPHRKPTTTTSGGTAMTSGVSYGGLKARIMGISDRTKETQGPLSQAIQNIETQIAEATAANEESQALNETIQALQRAKELCEEALQMLGVAGDQASQAAAQLQ